MSLIQHYFPELSGEQLLKFEKLERLYPEWNEKINVISRKDIDELVIRHILHSLAIAKFIHFNDGSKIIDIGTGGGFPGIPLAIFFPQCKFHLIDSIGKKIKVVETIAKELDLSNVETQQIRSEKLKGSYDFIVSRAVTAFPKFVALSKHLISQKQHNAITNGVIYLKGGDFSEELKPFKRNVSVTLISQYFNEDFFETKKIIHLSI